MPGTRHACDGGEQYAGAEKAVDALARLQEGGKPQWTVEDVKARQSKAVRAWLDKQVGPEKLELAKLLQEHAVIVRGGPDHAQRLMDALIVRAVASCGHHFCSRHHATCRHQWSSP